MTPHQANLSYISFTISMDVILGTLFGILLAAAVFVYFKMVETKKLASRQSVILLDKIKNVCKLISVEGDFAEIYHYEDVKQKFLKLISSKKKALVVVNAKAYVGFDLGKIKMKANNNSKTIVLDHFPQAEILSIETTLDYYDKQDGYFNKFDASDLTELNTEAKKHIKDKIPESGLYQAAQKEALEAILLIENLVQTIGWTLDYSALEVEDKKMLE